VALPAEHFGHLVGSGIGMFGHRLPDQGNRVDIAQDHAIHRRTGLPFNGRASDIHGDLSDPFPMMTVPVELQIAGRFRPAQAGLPSV
jgi:hypothetical protein